MGWFKKTVGFQMVVSAHKACEKCGLHYQPATGHEARWGHLCPVCRPAVMERDKKVDLVREWAVERWESLYEQAKKETDEADGQRAIGLNNVMNSQYNMAAQQSMANPYLIALYGGQGGLK